MKLKTSQTIRIGFAFLSICAFWQMYNNVIPLMLTNTFKINETFSGMIMAADNVLALFLLPLFGGISDRCNTKIGKRKPFIIVGTVIAVFLMLLIPFIDNSYFKNPSQGLLIAFICILGCILVAMGTYRSPAVALMPDATPKPLRSKGNAIINLMGAIGGIIYLIVATVLYSENKTKGLEHVNYLTLFAIVAAIMVVSLIVIMFAVDEVKWVAEVAAYEKAHPEDDLTETDEEGIAVLPEAVKKSLIFLLCSIALWFMGYNAVETWFTTYADKVYGMSLGSASFCLTIANIGAIFSYIPVGIISSKIGRKKTIKAGVVLLTICFAVAFLFTFISDDFSPVLYVFFALVGVAWASINVNSLPMVLEMCKGSDVGKFTGYYYTFSMTAQIITPTLAGFLLNRISYQSLFVYSAVFVALSFVTMCFVKHGDNKVEAKRGLEAFDFDD